MTSIVTVAVHDYPLAGRYLANLYSGLDTYLQSDFDFYCITDAHIPHSGIITVPQHRNVWGWWNLMEIFRPDAPWSGDDLLMFGLDTVIRDDVSWLLGHDVPVFLKPFSDQYGYESEFNGMVADGAVWLPSSDHLTWLWDEYVHNVTEAYTWQHKRGFMMHVWNTYRMRERDYVPLLWQDLYSNEVCSYRMPEPKTTEPEQSLVLFHGTPRPHEALDEATWLNKYWVK